MKRIIDGKRYDTDTAEEICSLHSRGLGRSDFKWEDTQLYRTRKGAWFLAGEGGPLTRWCRTVSGGMMTYGEGIIPLELDDARDILEREDATDALEKYFPVEEA